MKLHIRAEGKNFALCGNDVKTFAASPKDSDCKPCRRKFIAPPRPRRTVTHAPRTPVARGFEIGNSKEHA